MDKFDNKEIPEASVAAIISSLDGFSLKISLSASWLFVSSGSRLEKKGNIFRFDIEDLQM